MPAVLIDHYENEYMNISKKIAARLAENGIQVPRSMSVAPPSASLKSLEGEIAAAKQILDQMELETVNLEGHFKESGMSRLKVLRGDLNRFQFELANLLRGKRAEEMKNARERLFSDVQTDLEAGFDPSQQLLQQESSHTRLERTQRMALEAEQIGANVLSDLRRQREQIQHAGRALQDTDQDLDSSNRLLRDMLRRMRTNKMVMSGIITLLILAILLVIYSKIFH